MDLRRIIPTDITASAVASVVAGVGDISFPTRVRSAQTAGVILHEIVTAQEIAERQQVPEQRLPRTSRNQRQRRSRISPCSTSSLRPAHLRRQRNLPPPRRRSNRPPWPLPPQPSRQQPPAQSTSGGTVRARRLVRPVDQIPGVARLCRRICRRRPPAPAQATTRPTTILTRPRSRRLILPTTWSREFRGTSRPARNCRRR